MGRIKTSFVKRLGKEIFTMHAEQFTTDFEKNKKIVENYIDLKSKKLRNILAGYITSLKKQAKTNKT
jgi:small subunit ribosomal protein S17e